MTEQNDHTPMKCLRCNQPLTFVGTREFHEGPGGGLFSDLTELFMKKEKFEVYACQNCGQVEFFVSGIGEQFRQQGKTGKVGFLLKSAMPLIGLLS